MRKIYEIVSIILSHLSCNCGKETFESVLEIKGNQINLCT